MPVSKPGPPRTSLLPTEAHGGTSARHPPWSMLDPTRIHREVRDLQAVERAVPASREAETKSDDPDDSAAAAGVTAAAPGRPPAPVDPAGGVLETVARILHLSILADSPRGPRQSETATRRRS